MCSRATTEMINVGEGYTEITNKEMQCDSEFNKGQLLTMTSTNRRLFVHRKILSDTKSQQRLNDKTLRSLGQGGSSFALKLTLLRIWTDDRYPPNFLEASRLGSRSHRRSRIALAH